MPLGGHWIAMSRLSFRSRRFVNWFLVGSLYGSFYVGRYNLSIISPYLAELGYSRSQIGILFAAFLWSYALGLFINGFLADRFGGKRSLQVAAIGTMAVNPIFGLLLGKISFPWLAVIWASNGYIQSFAAPGMVKINAAWFKREERGRFTAIFGVLIQGGRSLAYWLIPASMLGLSIFVWKLPPLHYVSAAFLIPPILIGVLMLINSLVIAEEPSNQGLEYSSEKESGCIKLKPILKPLLLAGGAYLCTGAARSGLEQWYPLYLEEHFGVLPTSVNFQFLAQLMVFMAVLGPFIAGYLSDLIAHGYRGLVSACSYAIVSVMAFIGFWFTGFGSFCVVASILALTINAPHSTIGSAAPMDLGKVVRTGSSTGIIDSFQYIGSGLSALLVGYLIDHYSWTGWWVMMIIAGALGAILLLWYRNEEA